MSNQVQIKPLGSNIEDLQRQILIGKFLDTLESTKEHTGYRTEENGNFGGDEYHYCRIVGEIDKLPPGADASLLQPGMRSAWQSSDVPDDAWVLADIHRTAAAVVCHQVKKVVTQKYLKGIKPEVKND